jgi:protein SCO1/2
MRVPSVLPAALVLLTAGCASPDHREFTLQGQILSVSDDRKEATIKHEAIKGLMPAMTMPYKAREGTDFGGLQPGDLITSMLVIVANGAYLDNVRRVGDAPLEKAAATPLAATTGSELLKPGEPVPNTAFVDQDGARRDFASFRNSTVVITFIYTRCPMPTFCPLMDRHFKAVQEKLAGDASLNDVRLVSISFDPANDTPPVLKAHATKLGADPNRWTFLTGDRDEIDKFALRFGVSITRNLNDPIDITHNLRTAIIDRQGRLVKAFSGNEWTPEQVLAELRRIATKQSG